MGSTPEVTPATNAPLPVGATVVIVELRIPPFWILSRVALGRFFTNLLLLKPGQSFVREDV